jgi:hypothetical protein
MTSFLKDLSEDEVRFNDKRWGGTCTGTQRYGLEFVGLSSSERAQLRRYVKRWQITQPM